MNKSYLQVLMTSYIMKIVFRLTILHTFMWKIQYFEMYLIIIKLCQCESKLNIQALFQRKKVDLELIIK